MEIVHRKITLDSIRTHTPGILPYVANGSEGPTSFLSVVTPDDTNGNWGEILPNIRITGPGNDVLWEGSATGLLDIYFKVRNAYRNGMKLKGLNGGRRLFNVVDSTELTLLWYQTALYNRSDFSRNRKGEYYLINGNEATLNEVTVVDDKSEIETLLKFEPLGSIEQRIQTLVGQIQKCVGVLEIPKIYVDEKVPSYLYFTQVPLWLDWFKKNELLKDQDCCVKIEWERMGGDIFRSYLTGWWNETGSAIFADPMSYVTGTTNGTRVTIVEDEPTISIPLSISTNTMDAGTMTPYDESVVPKPNDFIEDAGLLRAHTIDGIQLESRLSELRSRKRVYDNSGELMPYIKTSANRLVIPYEPVLISGDDIYNIFNTYIDSDGTYVCDYVEKIEYFFNPYDGVKTGISEADAFNVYANRQDGYVSVKVTYVIGGNPKSVPQTDENDCYITINGKTGLDDVIIEPAIDESGGTITITAESNCNWSITIGVYDEDFYLKARKKTEQDNEPWSENTLTISNISPFGDTISIEIDSNTNWRITEASENLEFSRINGNGVGSFSVTVPSGTLDNQFNILYGDDYSSVFSVNIFENTGSLELIDENPSTSSIKAKATKETPLKVVFNGKGELYHTKDMRPVNVSQDYGVPPAKYSVIAKINDSISHDWVAYTNAEWCTLTSVTGTGADTIQIQVTENTSIKRRNCNLVVKFAGVELEVLVYQSASIPYELRVGKLTKEQDMPDVWSYNTVNLEVEDKARFDVMVYKMTDDFTYESKSMAFNPPTVPDTLTSLKFKWTEDEAWSTNHLSKDEDDVWYIYDTESDTQYAIVETFNNEEKYIEVENLGPGGKSGNFLVTVENITDEDYEEYAEQITGSKPKLVPQSLTAVSPTLTLNVAGEALYIYEDEDIPETDEEGDNYEKYDEAWDDRTNHVYDNPHDDIELNVYTTVLTGWTTDDIEYNWFHVSPAEITIPYLGGSKEIKVNSTYQWDVIREYYIPGYSPITRCEYFEHAEEGDAPFYCGEDFKYVKSIMELPDPELSNSPEYVYVVGGIEEGCYKKDKKIEIGGNYITPCSQEEYDSADPNTKGEQNSIGNMVQSMIVNGYYTYVHIVSGEGDEVIDGGYYKLARLEDWAVMSYNGGAPGESSVSIDAPKNEYVAERALRITFSTREDTAWGKKVIFYVDVIQESSETSSINDFTLDKNSRLLIKPTFVETAYNEHTEVEDVNYLLFTPSGGYKVATLQSTGSTFWVTDITYPNTSIGGSNWCEVIPGSGVAGKTNDKQHIAVLCHEYTSQTATTQQELVSKRRRALVKFTNIANTGQTTTLELYQEPPIFIVQSTLSTSPYNFEGGMSVLGNVNTNLVWEAGIGKVEGDTSDDIPSDWVLVLPESGYENSQPQIQLSRNNTPDERSAKITISAFTQSSKYGENNGYNAVPILVGQSAFTITQEAGIYLNVWKDHIDGENANGKEYQYSSATTLNDTWVVDTNNPYVSQSEPGGWTGYTIQQEIRVKNIYPNKAEILFTPLNDAIQVNPYEMQLYFGYTLVTADTAPTLLRIENDNEENGFGINAWRYLFTNLDPKKIYTFGVKTYLNNSDVDYAYIQVSEKTLPYYKLKFEEDPERQEIMWMVSARPARNNNTGSVTIAWNEVTKAVEADYINGAWVETPGGSSVSYTADNYKVVTGDTQARVEDHFNDDMYVVGSLIRDTGITFSHILGAGTNIWIGVKAFATTEDSLYYRPSDITYLKVTIPNTTGLTAPEVTCTATAPHSLTFGWTHTQTAHTLTDHYVIDYSKDGENWYNLSQNLSSGASSYTLTGYTNNPLESEHDYYFRIMAVPTTEAVNQNYSESDYASASGRTDPDYLYVYKYQDRGDKVTVQYPLDKPVKNFNWTGDSVNVTAETSVLTGWTATVSDYNWKYYLRRPTNVIVTGRTVDSLTLQWRHQVELGSTYSPIKYHIDMYVDNVVGDTATITGETSVALTDVSTYAPTFTFNNVPTGKTYTAVITATVDNENIVASKSDYGNNVGVGLLSAIVLKAPTNVSMVSNFPSQLTVSWSNSNTSNVKYILYYWDNGTNSNNALTASSVTTTYTIDGLSANTVYWVKIKTVRNTSESPKLYFDSSFTSNSSGRTHAPITLNAPSLVEGTVTETTITVTWGTVVGATGYTIGISSDGQDMDWAITQDVGPTTTSFTFTGLTSNTNYSICGISNGDGVNYITSAPGWIDITTTTPVRPEITAITRRITITPSVVCNTTYGVINGLSSSTYTVSAKDSDAIKWANNNTSLVNVVTGNSGYNYSVNITKQQWESTTGMTTPITTQLTATPWSGLTEGQTAETVTVTIAKLTPSGFTLTPAYQEGYNKYIISGQTVVNTTRHKLQANVDFDWYINYFSIDAPTTTYLDESVNIYRDVQSVGYTENKDIWGL